LLRQFAQSFLQLVPVVSRERELCAVLKVDAIFTMEPGFEFSNAGDAHDRGAMDANKFLGIELRLKTSNGLSQQVGFFCRMD
jgi:hypothetical protein